MEPFPADVEWSTLLVVDDIDRARHFYRDVLGATLEGEYGGTSLVLRLGAAWLLVVTGGGPTEDKPDTEFAPPADPTRIDHSITIKVQDCRETYDVLKSRGAEFLTPPVESEWEIRAFFRDPDGHLFEISETKA
jgi:catechol 2,3-dioxygenase-like lactoylglutathione lyase family enzyme